MAVNCIPSHSRGSFVNLCCLSHYSTIWSTFVKVANTFRDVQSKATLTSECVNLVHSV